MGSLSCKVDTSQVVQGLNEIQQRLSSSVRRAAFKGAVLVRDEALARVPVSKEAHFFYSKRGKDGKRGQKYLFYPGDLKRSIYMAYSKDNSIDGLKATYHVSFRAGHNGGAPYAYMVEFGTSRMVAKPFLRPAYDAMNATAQQVIVDELVEQLDGS